MKIALRAHELPALLDRAPPGIRVLSLDCFDTLLWRNCQAPADVFATLGLAGGGIASRTRAEELARIAKRFATSSSEVSIEEIHRRLLPQADEAALAASVAAELAAEAAHCFGFAPVMALIEAARARGWRVIVVSDTYLSATQLRALIAAAAGTELAAAIDDIFVSSEHGLAKSEGLFGPVLDALGVPPATILHLGDNPEADQAAAAALGICSAHLLQFDAASVRRLRLEAVAATLLDPATRRDHAPPQPHRPLISLRQDDDHAWTLGHDVIGPLMHAFAGWVRDEAAAWSLALGRPVKPLFLLRDGWLPFRFHQAIGDAPPGCVASVSRLTASRAGFIDAAAVRRFVEGESGKHSHEMLAGLLLLTRPEALALSDGKDDPTLLARAALAPAVIDKVMRRSARYADRLVEHVRRAGIAPGDAVMLVDLGYNGTVQNRLEPVLRARLGADVCGRYLLLREQEASGLAKRGFFDERNYDHATLDALAGPIAVVEQLSTVAQGSTLDYRPNGKPIHDTPRAKHAQSAVRETVQAGALAFAHASAAYPPIGAKTDNADGRRRMAAAVLARLLFLPSAEEVAVLERFDHDVNLGTGEVVRLIDPEDSAVGLRQRGMPYVQQAKRMFLPGELQRQGLPLSLALFGISRFGLDLREADFQAGPLSVPVIFADDNRQSLVPCDAFPTHDGFYALSVPARGGMGLGIQLGAICEVVQLDGISFHHLPHRLGDTPLAARALPDGMEELADSLYRCAATGLLFVQPPTVRVNTAPLVLTMVFRPVVNRSPSAVLRQAA